MARYQTPKAETANTASAPLEKAWASARECLGQILPAADMLKGCRAEARLSDAALLIEKGAATLREVADELQRVISSTTAASLRDERASRLTRWFGLSPEIKERFVSAVSRLRALEVGDFRSLEQLTGELRWSDAESPKAQVAETDAHLRSMWKVNMFARNVDAEGRVSYALSVEARALLESGAFASLGLPGNPGAVDATRE